MRSKPHNSFLLTWWQNIKKLFQASEQSSPVVPAFHEALERDEIFVNKYNTWKNGIVKKRFFTWLIDQYTIYQNQPTNIDQAFDFLDIPTSKGFAVHLFKTNYTKQEAQYILEYLREKAQELRYIKQLADVRSYNRPNWVETVERYYLKPSRRIESSKKVNQLYGNIRIELLFRNDKVYQLKFSATHYQDHLYEAPKDFSQLIQYLCFKAP